MRGETHSFVIKLKRNSYQCQKHQIIQLIVLLNPVFILRFFPEDTSPQDFKMDSSLPTFVANWSRQALTSATGLCEGRKRCARRAAIHSSLSMSAGESAGFDRRTYLKPKLFCSYTPNKSSWRNAFWSFGLRTRILLISYMVWCCTFLDHFSTHPNFLISHHNGGICKLYWWEKKGAYSDVYRIEYSWDKIIWNSCCITKKKLF